MVGPTLTSSAVIGASLFSRFPGSLSMTCCSTLYTSGTSGFIGEDWHRDTTCPLFRVTSQSTAPTTGMSVLPPLIWQRMSISPPVEKTWGPSVVSFPVVTVTHWMQFFGTVTVSDARSSTLLSSIST
uniref:Putative secreted protein n=1 Tax=Ixodes ricinus TaxID=34613 RepID=A0A6B0UQ02_IXORI